MSHQLTIFLLLSLTFISKGVSNRVIEDITQLKKLGFELKSTFPNSEQILSFMITVPRKFYIDERVGTKTYKSISFVKTLEQIEKGPKLISATQSHFQLATEITKNGRSRASASVLESDIAKSYMLCSFQNGLNDWPMLIFIPIETIEKEIKSQKPIPLLPQIDTDSRIQKTIQDLEKDNISYTAVQKKRAYI